MRGAVALENAWLKKDTLHDVAVYVVWSPQLGAQEKNVADATKLVPDGRARHYWDGSMLVGSAFQPLIGSQSAAWDTWMVFDKITTWRDSVPRPAWWEHQMSSGPPALMLDPDRWTSHAIALHDMNANHR